MLCFFMTTKNNIFDNPSTWKISTAVLLTLLLMSWVYFQFVSIMNDGAFETLNYQRTELRNLNNQIINMSIQLEDLRAKNQILEGRIESFNNMRIRDHEFAMSQINRPPVKTIR